MSGLMLSNGKCLSRAFKLYIFFSKENIETYKRDYILKFYSIQVVSKVIEQTFWGSGARNELWESLFLNFGFI